VGDDEGGRFELLPSEWSSPGVRVVAYGSPPLPFVPLRSRPFGEAPVSLGSAEEDTLPPPMMLPSAFTVVPVGTGRGSDVAVDCCSDAEDEDFFPRSKFIVDR